MVTEGQVQALDNLKKMGADDETIEYFEMIYSLHDYGVTLTCLEDSSDHMISMIREVLLSHPLYDSWSLECNKNGFWVEVGGKPFTSIFKFQRKALLECIGKLKAYVVWRDKQWVPMSNKS